MQKTTGRLHESSNTPLLSTSKLCLTTVSTYAAERQQDFPAHQHDVWELIYYLDGRIQCVTAHDTFYTQPGLLLIIPPKTVHFDLALTAYKQIYAHVQCDAVPAWLQSYRDDHERTLLSLFAGLRREWRGRAANRAEMLVLLVRQLDIVLRRKWSEPEPTAAEQLVQTAERLLEEQLGLSPSIKAIAAEMGVSTSTLRAYFVKLRGHGPKAYLQQLRQRRAIELISTSNLSLDAIASLCGYHSASHLSRYVKRDTGCTPGTFRDSKYIQADFPR